MEDFMKKGLWITLTLVVLAGTMLCMGACSKNKSASDTITVEFFSLNSSYYDIMEKLIGDFEAQNPGVKIVQNAPPDSWGVLRTRLIGNDAPEIFTSWGGPDYRMWVESGYIADLTDLPAIKNVADDARELLRVNGRDYLIAIARNVLGLWVNVDMFKQLNLNYPTTWAEMIKVCDAFRAAGITPALLCGKDLWTLQEEIQVHLLTMPSWRELDKDVEKHTVDFSDRSKPYYQDVRDMAQRVIIWCSYGQEDVLGTGPDQLRNDFATGKAAMCVDGSWSIPEFLGSNPNLNFTMIPFPAVNARDTLITHAPDDFAVTYSATAKYPDIAKKFMEFMASKETALYFAEQSGSLSAIKGVNYSSPYLLDAYAFINSGNGIPYPNYEWSPEQMDNIGVAFQGLYASGNIEAFCRDLQTGFNTP